MKTKTPLVAALMLGMHAMAGAFTLDAAGYEGGELSSTPFSVFVSGYGELQFQALGGVTLPVNSAFRNDNGFGGPSLTFKQNDSVKVTFKGPEPLNVDFDFVGVSAGEAFQVEKDLFTPQAFVLTLKGSGDGAGLYAISWKTEAIPEPTTALMGLLGGVVFAMRRRR